MLGENKVATASVAAVTFWCARNVICLLTISLASASERQPQAETSGRHVKDVRPRSIWVSCILAEQWDVLDSFEEVLEGLRVSPGL